MTEFDIQDELFDTFLTLDTFASSQGYTGESYFDTDTQGNVLNVHFPNKPFDYPENKLWFDLTFINNEPVDAAIMQGAQARYTGMFYIDIFTPNDVGEDECAAIYSWIAMLFHSVNIDDVDIMQVYISTKGNEADHYRLQVAVVWEADIDKE